MTVPRPVLSHRDHRDRLASFTDHPPCNGPGQVMFPVGPKEPETVITVPLQGP